MAVVTRVVCLANSRRDGGRCIAGKEQLANGSFAGWVRPVSIDSDGALSEFECCYEDGNESQVMDIVDIPLIYHRPDGHQQEDWLLSPNECLVKVGRVEWSELERLVDPTKPLWINGYCTARGLNDRVPHSVAETLQDSLRLIRVNSLTIRVSTEEVRGRLKQKVRGRFRHNGTDYGLVITDPHYEGEGDLVEGDSQLGECFLTVSLGEPYKGHCYKLIAAVIEREH